MFRICIAVLSRKNAGVASLVALFCLVVAATAGGDSLATCSKKPEQLYTPNESAIKAEVEKLQSFERDMRAVIQDMKTLQSDDAWNRRLGKLQGYRSVTDQSLKALCAGANAGAGLAPGAVGYHLELYGTICRGGEKVSGAINDVISCASGEALECAALGLKWQKRKIDRRVKGLGGSDKDSDEDPRYMLNDDLQVAKGEARLNELKQKGVEAAKKGKEVASKATEKDFIGLTKEACDISAAGLEAVGKAGPGVKRGKEGCSAATYSGKALETYGVVQDLDEASQGNQVRIAKLVQLLESKVDDVSQRSGQLRAEVYAIDWGAMGKPEPNMTPIKQEGCDDELDRLANDGLGEMDRVRQAAPVREPAQSGSDMDGLAILGEVLGNAAALNQQFKQQQDMYNSQRTSPPLQGNTRDRSNDCAARMARAGRSAFECNTVAPDPPSGQSYSQPTQSRQPSQGGSPSGGGSGCDNHSCPYGCSNGSCKRIGSK